jgi:hypothetical protein
MLMPKPPRTGFSPVEIWGSIGLENCDICFSQPSIADDNSGQMRFNFPSKNHDHFLKNMVSAFTQVNAYRYLWAYLMKVYSL